MSASSHRMPGLEAMTGGSHRLSKSGSKPPLSHLNFIALAWTQIVIASLVCTLSRGTLNALNAVGGLGTGDVQTATMVNLLSSISFSLLSWSTGGIVNMVGYRSACAIGSFTTCCTLSTLMMYTMFHLLPPWVVMVAATFDGIGSGVLWTASGTILIKYPSDRRKGFASTILFAIYSMGAALGGLMAFAMNISSRESTTLDLIDGLPPHSGDNLPLTPIVNAGLKPASYSVMISLAVVALVLSFTIKKESAVIDRYGHQLIDPRGPPSSESLAGALAVGSFISRSASRRDPSRVSLGSNRSSFRLFSRSGREEIRHVPNSQTPLRERSVTPAVKLSPRDDFDVEEPSAVAKGPDFLTTASHELRALLSTLQERNVQFMIMFSFASLFHQTYLFNGINYRAFNVRTRGLNCFMYWIGRIPAGFFHGFVVDDMRFSSHRRGLHGLTLLLTLVAACQCLTVFFWSAVPPGRFDVMVDPSNAALAFVAFFLYGGLDTVSQSFALWIFSCLGRRHPTRVPHYVALFRSFQGFGVALAWFLDLNSFASYHTQFLVCAITWLAALPGLLYVIHTLPRTDAAVLIQYFPGKAPSLIVGDDAFDLGSFVDSSVSKIPEVSTQPNSHEVQSEGDRVTVATAAGEQEPSERMSRSRQVTHDQMGRQMDVEVLSV
eukprot:Blabericola_migrator_1__9532@NODE_518_length_7920_cov_188_180568_g396_i0_p2_GENE_NODE_518_length_7920_cov_188_180568_g396_i0NODE_518_length_7920_cov_188_180568_g396_i0_p2_ORF_typecomplete_len663_score76_26UNC93/PF05978_16/2_9e03UNC93/PF05978_16/3_7e14UNC93/PF05978_16/2_4e03MFS_1/PF07690_16/6_3e13MFS_1/PF07690_16/3_4e02MFS_4/PF06779_14/9_6e02MFS_4/PF06779_14/0_0047MFS_4/PF06779_14/2_4e02_NODE_518_length_7920_cov_188_180568_g396_i014003388